MTTRHLSRERQPPICLDCGQQVPGSPPLTFTWYDKKTRRAVQPLCEPCFRCHR